MKLDVDGLEAFVVISELQSFSRAADALNVSPSALSRRLKRMEDVAGVRLLERTTQRVALTAIGKMWLPEAQRLVTDLRAATARLSDAGQRWLAKVTVACIPTAAAHFLPQGIARYGQTHPDVQVRVRDLSSIEVVEAVRDGTAEFGVTFINKLDPGLAFEALFDDPLIVVCSKGHPLARSKKVTWRELSAYRVARVGRRSGTSLLVDLMLERIGLKLRWFHEVEYHFSSALGLTERGSVVTVLPRLAFPSKGQANLIAKPLGDPPLVRRLGIVRREDNALSTAAQGLILTLTQDAAKLRPRSRSSSRDKVEG